MARMDLWGWRSGDDAERGETDGFLRAMGAGNKRRKESEKACVPVVEPKKTNGQKGLEFFSTCREKNDSLFCFFG